MTIRRLINTLMALASLCTLTACYNYDREEPPQGRSEVYVQLRINVGSTTATDTRADDPMGGDVGNGREEGINNENKLHNVTLLLFKDLTSSTVEQTVVFGASELTQSGNTYETYPRKLTLDLGVYHVVALANLNPLSVSDFSGKTFRQVADMMTTQPWVNIGSNINATDFFTMTSTNDVTITIARDPSDPTKGTYENPFVAGTLTIERLAARIDIDATGSKAGQDFVYDYKDATDNVVGTVTVKEIRALNLLNSGTYLLKHFSASGTAADVTFFDSEGTSPTQSKYVLDPNTTAKTAEGTPSYYTSPMPVSVETGLAWATTPALLTADKTVATGDDAGHKYFILAYAQENTLPPVASGVVDALLPKYATALAVHYTITEGATTTDHYDTYYLKHNNNSDMMRYSVVRNNIYRVTLVPPVKSGSAMTINIKVKKWDKFTHSTIYM